MSRENAIQLYFWEAKLSAAIDFALRITIDEMIIGNWKKGIAVFPLIRFIHQKDKLELF